MDDHVQVFLCKKQKIGRFLAPCLTDNEFTIHILGLKFENETDNVNCTFNHGGPFSANVTSAAHHSFHFKLSMATADGSLAHCSRLAAPIWFVT